MGPALGFAFMSLVQVFREGRMGEYLYNLYDEINYLTSNTLDIEFLRSDVRTF